MSGTKAAGGNGGRAIAANDARGGTVTTATARAGPSSPIRSGTGGAAVLAPAVGISASSARGRRNIRLTSALTRRVAGPAATGCGAAIIARAVVAPGATAAFGIPGTDHRRTARAPIQPHASRSRKRGPRACHTGRAVPFNEWRPPLREPDRAGAHGAPSCPTPFAASTTGANRSTERAAPQGYE